MICHPEFSPASSYLIYPKPDEPEQNAGRVMPDMVDIVHPLSFTLSPLTNQVAYRFKQAIGDDF